MSFLVRSLVMVVLGTLLGLALTQAAVVSGTGAAISQSRAGPWQFVPRAGAPDADPYTRATAARSGQIALGAAEGLTFLARLDSAGQPLRPACVYTLTGNLPVARVWTLTLLGLDGLPLPDGGARVSITSSELARAEDGSATLVLAPEARAGNWLATPTSKPFVLMLRLYDTGAGSTLSALNASVVPKITPGPCQGARP